MSSVCTRTNVLIDHRQMLLLHCIYFTEHWSRVFFLLHFHSLSEAWNLSFTNTYLWMHYTHNNLRHSLYWQYFFKFTQIMITQAFWALQLSFHLSLTHKNLLRLLDKGLCWDPSLEPWGISGMTPQRWTSAAPRWSPVSSCCTAPRSPGCK